MRSSTDRAPLALPGLLALSLLACSGPRNTLPVAPPPRSEPPPTTPDAALPSDASAEPQAPGLTLLREGHGCPERSPALASGANAMLVASTNGLRELDDHGATLRLLTSTPATNPRYTRDRSAVVFLVPEQGEVRRLDLTTCSEWRLATLPGTLGVGCGGIFTERYDPVAHVQSGDDAWLDASGEALCLRVQDRNTNMASVMILHRVALADGARTSTTLVSESCGHDPREPSALGCAPATTDAPTPSTRAFPFTLRDSTIVRGTRPVRQFTTEVDDGPVSPSGRWMLAFTNREEGDYIYSDVLLLDRTRGTLHPLVEGTFPPALGADSLRSLASVHGHTLTINGESETRFTGVGDQLLVGGLLVIPGERAVALGGDVAR